MSRFGFALISVALLATACSPPASETETSADSGVFPNSTAAYRAEAVVTAENGETTPVIMVRDGARHRMEFNSNDGRTVIITNAESGESFVLTDAGGRMIAMRASGIPNQFQNPTDAWQGELGSRATRTGTCSVAGQTGSEWTDSSDATKKACVTDDGIILRAVEGERTVWETTSVTRGPQAADQFELPPGVQVMDLGNLGGMMDAMKQKDR